MKFINWLKQFAADHKISSHTIATLAVIAVTAYYQVPAFHDYVVHVYGELPNGVRNLITAAIAVVAWYWKTQRPLPPPSNQ